MPRMSKKHPMAGSLLKQGKFVTADIVWDEEHGGYFIRDKVAKKRYGPYRDMVEADARGEVEFHADMGRRAEQQEVAA